jgi:hypothetical protein
MGTDEEAVCEIEQRSGQGREKGEEELVKFSKQSKLHIDATTVSLKKERLYHLIGKEYAGLKDPSQPTAKLGKLIEDLKKAEAEQQALKARIDQGQKRRTSSK